MVFYVRYTFPQIRVHSVVYIAENVLTPEVIYQTRAKRIMFFYHNSWYNLFNPQVIQAMYKQRKELDSIYLENDGRNKTFQASGNVIKRN